MSFISFSPSISSFSFFNSFFPIGWHLLLVTMLPLSPASCDCLCVRSCISSGLLQEKYAFLPPPPPLSNIALI